LSPITPVMDARSEFTSEMRLGTRLVAAGLLLTLSAALVIEARSESTSETRLGTRPVAAGLLLSPAALVMDARRGFTSETRLATTPVAAGLLLSPAALVMEARREFRSETRLGTRSSPLVLEVMAGEEPELEEVIVWKVVAEAECEFPLWLLEAEAEMD